MFDAIRRLVWFAVVASGVTYVSLVFAGSIVESAASGYGEPVQIRDEVGRNVHFFSGSVIVPTPCDELSVRTESLSTTTYLLLLKTWREPSVPCMENEVPRYFRTPLFAPAAGINIIATLDDKILPIVVLPPEELRKP